MNKLLKKLLLFLNKIYKTLFSTLIKFIFGGGCRFQPTCSDYAKEALEKHNPFYATLLTLRRLSKCHPWGSSGYDPVPPANK